MTKRHLLCKLEGTLFGSSSGAPLMMTWFCNVDSLCKIWVTDMKDDMKIKWTLRERIITMKSAAIILVSSLEHVCQLREHSNLDK